jgi:hypothetical protein
MWVVEGTGDISPDQAAQPHAARGVTTVTICNSTNTEAGCSQNHAAPKENHVVPGVVRPLYEENKNASNNTKFAQFILNRAALVKGFHGLAVQIIATCDATEKRVKLL